MKNLTKIEIVKLISQLKIGGKGPHIKVEKRSLERLIKSVIGD